MQKLMRYSLALGLTAALALPALAKKADPLVVKSGSVQAVVNGKTQTFSEGQAIPEGAVLTAASDAVIESHGLAISVPAGASFQAARTGDGMIDVRANSGQVTVKGYGNTSVIPAGSEANVSGGVVQAIAGSVSVTTTSNGRQVQRTIGAGEQVTQSGVQGSNTVLGQTTEGTFATILPPPPPPNPVQNNQVVSPSAP